MWLMVLGCIMEMILLSGCASAHVWDSDPWAYDPNTGYPIIGRGLDGVEATVQLPYNPNTGSSWPSPCAASLPYNPNTGYPFIQTSLNEPFSLQNRRRFKS